MNTDRIVANPKCAECYTAAALLNGSSDFPLVVAADWGYPPAGSCVDCRRPTPYRFAAPNKMNDYQTAQAACDTVAAYREVAATAAWADARDKQSIGRLVSEVVSRHDLVTVRYESRSDDPAVPDLVGHATEPTAGPPWRKPPAPSAPPRANVSAPTTTPVSCGP